MHVSLHFANVAIIASAFR